MVCEPSSLAHSSSFYMLLLCKTCVHRGHRRWLYSRNPKTRKKANEKNKSKLKKHQQNKEQPRKQKKTTKSATKKAQAKQKATKKEKHTIKKQPKKNTSNTQRVVWRGRVGLVLDKGLFWRRVKCPTFGRFSGAGSEVTLLVACFSYVFPGPGKKSHFWSRVFPIFPGPGKKSHFWVAIFLLCFFCKNKANTERQKSDHLPGAGKNWKKKRPKVHQKVDPPPKVRQKARQNVDPSKKCARKPG